MINKLNITTSFIKMKKIIFHSIFYVCLSAFFVQFSFASKVKNNNHASSNKDKNSKYSFFTPPSQLYMNSSPFPYTGGILETGQSIDLSIDFRRNQYIQPDGSFLIFSADTNNVESYANLLGDDKNDIVVLKGLFSFGGKNLFGVSNVGVNLGRGYNTLHIEALNNSPTIILTTSFQNIQNFIIDNNVQIDDLVIQLPSSYDFKLTLNGGDPTQEKDIILGGLDLVGNANDNTSSHIAISGQVDVLGDINLSNRKTTIDLADAKLNPAGEVDKSTVSILSIKGGLKTFGGDKTLNLGRFAQIKLSNGSVDLGVSGDPGKGYPVSGYGNNTVNLAIGSSITGGGLSMGDGNNVINVASPGVQNTKNSIFKITLDSIILGNGNNTINVANGANFTVNSTINFSGNKNNRIIIGDHSVVNVNGSSMNNNISFKSGNNYIYLGTGSELQASIGFGDGINKIVVNTGDENTNVTTINGSVTAGSDQDIFQALGKGTVNINSSSVGGGSLLKFSNISLDQGYLYIENNYKQEKNTPLNLDIKINPSDSDEKKTRIAFDSLADFNNNSINLKIKGVSEYLNKVGGKYSLSLFRIGQKDDPSKRFEKFKDIKLQSLNFTSALYKINTSIEKNQLKVEVEKCSTFTNAVNGNNTCNTSGDHRAASNYVITTANFLDKILQYKLTQSTYDWLDNISMISREDLINTLEGFGPIKNELLYSINQNLGTQFKSIVFNNKPYKIIKNNLSTWMQYNYSNLDVGDNKYMIGANTTNGVFNFGLEYSFSRWLKVGANTGFASSDINGNNGSFKGTESSTYLGIYSFISFTKNLVLRLNVSQISGSFDLDRNVTLNKSALNSSPKISQSDLDAVVEYKIKFSKYLITPYTSLSYSGAKIKPYKESGDLGFSVNSSNANFLKLGLGSSILTVKKIHNFTFIPTVKVGFSVNNQNVDNTESYFNGLHKETINNNIPLEFNASNSLELKAEARASVGVIITSFLHADIGAGASISGDQTSYNIGTNVVLRLL